MNSAGFAKLSLYFYLAFLIVSLLGYVIFSFNLLSIYSLILYVVYVLFFLVGVAFGSKMVLGKFSHLTIAPRTILNTFFCISASGIMLGWLYMIRYFGDIPTIIGNSYTIRSETIGDGIQIIPTTISYMASFANAGFVMALSLYSHYKDKKDLLMSVAFGVLIFLVDLQSFGRVGILFIIFLIIGCILLFHVKIKLRKVLFYGSALLIILMIPRWIRGGSSIEGISDTYLPYLQYPLPEFLDPFVSLYAYYFSGLFAFSALIDKDIAFWYGERNFSSIINLFHRFFDSGADFHRITIIAEPVYVPYKHNIYMILGESYMDFGVLGLVLLPLFFGVCIGFFFRYKGIYADALKLVFIGWLFYTPIYNLFSFGGFMLAYMVLAFLTLTISPNAAAPNSFYMPRHPRKKLKI